MRGEVSEERDMLAVTLENGAGKGLRARGRNEP